MKTYVDGEKKPKQEEAAQGEQDDGVHEANHCFVMYASVQFSFFFYLSLLTPLPRSVLLHGLSWLIFERTNNTKGKKNENETNPQRLRRAEILPRMKPRLLD